MYLLVIGLHICSFVAYVSSRRYFRPPKQDFKRRFFLLDQLMQLEK